VDGQRSYGHHHGLDDPSTYVPHHVTGDHYLADQCADDQCADDRSYANPKNVNLYADDLSNYVPHHVTDDLSHLNLDDRSMCDQKWAHHWMDGQKKGDQKKCDQKKGDQKKMKKRHGMNHRDLQRHHETKDSSLQTNDPMKGVNRNLMETWGILLIMCGDRCLVVVLARIEIFTKKLLLRP